MIVRVRSFGRGVGCRHGWVSAERVMGIDTTSECRGEPCAARHRALLYGDADEFVGTVAPFIRAGVREGQHVLAALTPDKRAWAREALGDQGDAVEFIDAAAMYARNGPMLSSLVARLAAHGAPGRGRVRVIAEQAWA